MERQRGSQVDNRQGTVFRKDEQGGGRKRFHDGGEPALGVCPPDMSCFVVRYWLYGASLRWGLCW